MKNSIIKKTSVTGVIILMSISPLFRGLYFNYEAYAFLAAIALLSIIYFFAKMMNNEPVHINKWFMVFGIVLTAAAALSFIKAVNARENLECILQYIEYLVVFMILYDYFHDRKQRLISVIMHTTILAGFVCSITGLLALTGSFNIWDVTISNNRLGATFQYANTASIYFAICFLFALTLANITKSTLLRASLAGVGNIIVFAFFQTGSRGGYIVGMAVILLLLAIQPSGYKLKGFTNFVCMLAPVFIILKGFNMSTSGHDNLATAKWLAISFILAAILSLLFFLLTKIIFKGKSIPKPRGSGFVFIAAIVTIVVLAFVFRGNLISLLPPVLGSRLAQLNFNDINVLYRLEFDRDAFKLIADNWLFGLGGGGWKAIYQSVQDYFYTAVFVHNNYLQVFVESGILGFLSFVALILAGIVNAVYSYLKAADRVLKIYAGGLLCGLLALAFHSAVDFDLSYISMALLLWVMFAASATGLSAEPGAAGNDLPLSMGKWKLPPNESTVKIFLIVVCAVLFSMNAVYFAGAYNEHEALKYQQSKEYKAATAYYEEAYRLDPGNSAYAFELTKLYNYFANKSANAENKRTWLEKARLAGEKSVIGNRNYPAYMNTLAQTYLASGMPLKALEYAQKLVANQRYNREVYELLARSYLAAAEFYEKDGNTGKAKELLEKCIEIDRNPYLLKSNIDKPYKLISKEVLNSYKHSDKLLAYLNEASVRLGKLE